ncbi:hypothetical protein [Sandaracinus amylolyticus]|uniref:Uncharacterized protein n=1 Tax=Sandaracinus amylolyticus TaxID=927083 RepID=A0A0F6SH49_9BACT|nr:hypothetical protein [Sandaracinus amylolyticus]AKF09824.1 hypothetical protein DB32_006973 [Sandaracinus amylolyticus]
MRAVRRRIPAAILGSAALHALAVLALQLAPDAPPIEPRASREVTFVLTEDPPPAQREDERPRDPAARAEVIPSAARSRAMPRVVREHGDVAALVPTPSESTGEAPLEAPPVREAPPTATETEAERRERIRRLVDPAAVARSAFVVEGAPSTRSGPATAPLEALAPRSEHEAQRDLDERLRAAAMTKQHTARERLVARARPDGTYVFEHGAFTAVITADGQVQYEDAPAIRTEGVSASGTLDFNDMIERAQGRDPYAAEKQRFEDDNAELIERLEREGRERAMAAALRRLRGRLARVWADDVPAAQRRRQLFELWRDVDDSGGDGGAREVIESFIRDNLPLGHADAYAPDELSRMNAMLEAPSRFDPYR